ncbi:MAG: hypothetical protein M1281_13410 [Chloroflexi bacterium]|nr:hypothetical protein [Chloroflexota bacterium]
MNANSAIQTPTSTTRESPGSVFLGILLFLIAGAGWVLLETPGDQATRFTGHQIAGGLLFGGYLVIMAVLLAGILKGFPRWVMPYLSYGVIFGLYISNASTPGLSIFGIQLWAKALWGVRACVPMILVILIAAAFWRSLIKPLQKFVDKILEDWTLVAFGIFGLLPLIAILMDEVDHNFSFPILAIAEGILVAGALLYMLIRKPLPRFLALVLSAALSVILMGSASSYYWQTHTMILDPYRIVPTGVPVDFVEMLLMGLRMALGIMVLFLPTLALWYYGTKRRSHGSISPQGL